MSQLSSGKGKNIYLVGEKQYYNEQVQKAIPLFRVIEYCPTWQWDTACGSHFLVERRNDCPSLAAVRRPMLRCNGHGRTLSSRIAVQLPNGTDANATLLMFSMAKYGSRGTVTNSADCVCILLSASRDVSNIS